ncbi:phenylalanine--tRNA ligase alpha subunit, cytoplasmic-like, partial [Neltuma alba]
MAEEAILSYLEKGEVISDSGVFASERGIDHNEIVNVIKSLHGFGYVDAEDIKRETWVLTDEGKTYAAAGSPEVQLFLAIPPEGISKEELQKKLNPAAFKIGCAQAAKNKWVELGKQLISRK